MIQKWLVLFIFLVSTSSFAGVDTSGGGNSVVCFSSVEMRQKTYNALVEAERAGINAVNPFADAAIQSGINKVESLDFYLHKLPRGREQSEFLSLFNPDGMQTPDQVISELLARLGMRNSFSREVRVSMDQLRWISADGVARIADTGLPVLFPPNCLVAQTAYRKGDQIFFDRHLYTRMDIISQAILVLHEAIYSIAKDQGATDAFRVYDVVSLLLRSDEEFNRIPSVDLAAHILRLLYTDREKFLISNCDTKYGDSSLQLKQRIDVHGNTKIFFERHHELDVAGHRVVFLEGTTGTSCQFSLTGAHFTRGSTLASYLGWVKAGKELSSGLYLSSITLHGLAADASIQGRHQLSVKNQSGFMRGNIELEDQTTVLILPGEIRLSAGKVWWSPKEWGPSKEVLLTNIVLGENGETLESGVLTKDLRITAFREIKAGTRIYFGADGKIKTGSRK